MAITQEMLDQLLKEYQKPEDLLGEGGLIKQLTKALLNRVMEGELRHQLGYEKNGKRPNGNARNGKYKKTIVSKEEEIEIDVPRDRLGQYEPKIVKKGQRRFDGFDGKIISMYARGMTTRDIQAHLEEIYGVEVSPELISTVTDAVMDAIYPIVYMDALQITVRQDGRVINKAVYLAIAVNLSGIKEVLGMWMAETEGAKFWLSIVTELKNRGVKDIFIACVDGLKGLPEAIEAIFPKTEVQTCIVHLIRHCLNYVPEKDRKQVAADLKTIYTAATLEEAELNLEIFESTYNSKYPRIAKSWRANWARVIPFLAFPQEIRKLIYTTNAIESLSVSLRKIIKNRSLFPNDEAVMKLLYLALRNASKRWTMPIRDWRFAMNQFAIIYGDRVPLL
ncbi:MAG: IS256 family transposase [Acidobacteriota bacterium]